MMKHLLYTSLLSVTLIGCSEIPKEAYFNRGEPESLLDVSSEVVNLRVDSPSSVQDVTNWINQDQPTRAELSCQDGDPTCSQVQNVLHQFSVPVKFTSAGDNNLVLVYERVVARDCENRFIDNSINPYNLNHPTFGCSTAANVVQMVSDKRQFTSPPLMDYPDAYKTSQTMSNYAKPTNYTPPTVDSNFQALATQQTLTPGDSGGGISSSGGGGGGTTTPVTSGAVGR